MSGTRHVQLKTATPLGADLSGLNPSRKIACQTAKSLYESDGTDSRKCSAYGSGINAACKSEEQPLP
jgi:hypothetical protein